MGRVLINGQRTLPHSIMVNRRGRRFTNEAANYNAFGSAFHAEDVSRFEYANLPCWLVFDQNYADRYGFRVASGIEAHGVPGWLARGATPSDLATVLGIDRGPFYAVEIHSGCLGTKGGPQVDPNARVLDVDGDPIPGLYAAGNVMGSPFGMTYGGAGGTIGPAMVFGYLAGIHAAGRAPRHA